MVRVRCLIGSEVETGGSCHSVVFLCSGRPGFLISVPVWGTAF